MLALGARRIFGRWLLGLVFGVAVARAGFAAIGLLEQALRVALELQALLAVARAELFGRVVHQAFRFTQGLGQIFRQRDFPQGTRARIPTFNAGRMKMLKTSASATVEVEAVSA